MGYRPTIRYMGSTTGIELGKFYGYLDKEKYKTLPSVQYLFDHYKIFNREDPSAEFMFGGEPTIIFTADEFREWFDLYVKDINETDMLEPYYYETEYDPFEEFPELSDMYDNDYPKIVEWG